MTNEQFIKQFLSQLYTDKENRNLFFTNNILYSYGKHTPITRIITIPDQRYGILLLPKLNYSITTTKQIKLVRKTAIMYRHIFTVVDVLADTLATHRGNLVKMKVLLATYKLKREKARTPSTIVLWDKKWRLLNKQITEYTNFFL